jgi:lysophospholipase L1-like esterase
VREQAVTAVAAWLDAEPTLANAGALVPFLEQLYRIDKQISGGPLHILHFGDSHTASDEWTGTLRYLLQTRFGDGGPGFTFAGRPFAGCRRLDVKGASTRGWITQGLVGRTSDGMVGLGGISIRTSRAGERVTLEAESERAELLYLKQPGGGEVEIRDNGSAAVRLSTDGPAGPGVAPLPIAGSNHQLELKTLSRAPVRLFGWVAENSKGLTYESAGINGAQATAILDWDEPLFSAYVAHRNPALIVLAYGTNEAGQKDWTQETYRAAFSQVLARLRRASPTASLLVIGPPDRYQRVRGKWVAHPGVDRIAAAQREAALAAGAAFWDLRSRMGGPGSMRQWVYAGMAHFDYVHFAAPGYRMLGAALYKELLDAYAAFSRVREETSPVGDNSSNAGNGYPRTDP